MLTVRRFGRVDRSAPIGDVRVKGASATIQSERVRALNDQPARDGKYVVYWMQASQRAEFNHALEYAVQEANRLGQPLVAVFGLTDEFPEANLRHYAFMLEGLRQAQAALARRGVQLVVRRQSPGQAAIDIARDASMLITDVGYLRIQKKWRQHVADNARCFVVQVETDAIVPVEIGSGKEEYAAATLRPKIHRQLDRFLVPLKTTPLRRDSLGLRLGGVDLSNVEALLADLRVDKSVSPVDTHTPGTMQAKRRLKRFIAERLKDYPTLRNDPSLDCVSHMSPYLHFGQISPLYVALQIAGARGVGRQAKDAYLEELIVRRELSLNFVHYNRRYDSYRALPAWARTTLADHRRDRRPVRYSADDLEHARTDDPYWNAAQREMVLVGKMHNYMRMYWGKKILEWTSSPQQAFRIALRLNNKYELDGRDPNSFAGVAWCFGKHDRPWSRRPIFGTVRYMNAAGLRRKFDIDAYVRKVEQLER